MDKTKPKRQKSANLAEPQTQHPVIYATLGEGGSSTKAVSSLLPPLSWGCRPVLTFELRRPLVFSDSLFLRFCYLRVRAPFGPCCVGGLLRMGRNIFGGYWGCSFFSGRGRVFWADWGLFWVSRDSRLGRYPADSWAAPQGLASRQIVKIMLSITSWHEDASLFK